MIFQAMRHRPFLYQTFLSVILFLIAGPALSQGTSASLSGTVLDTTGAAISDASVVLENVDTKTTQATKTTSAGTYFLTNVQPGNYFVRVSAPGFNTVEKTGLVLQVNQSATIGIVLPVGKSEQTVDVSASLSVVDSSTSELGTVVTERSVKDLPLNGRNFTQLLTLAPGISPVTTGQNSGGSGGWAGDAIGASTFPAVGGQRNRSNMFLLDGVNDLAFVGNYNYSPIVDSIQEFKVQSHNDLAEFGQVMGGIINTATKAGTNSLHGTLWEFLRNEQMDARDYFANVRDPLRQNQFGGQVGGPVIVPHLYSGNGHNKTFFFFTYEGFRRSVLSLTPLQVPTAAELSGDFSADAPIYDPVDPNCVVVGNTCNNDGFTRQPFPNNQIPANRISPIAALYAKTLFPAAGSPIPGQGTKNLYDNTRQLASYNNYSGRIDQVFGTHDALFGRISYSNQPQSSSAGFPGVLNYVTVESWNIAVHETHSFGPTAILDLTFGRNLGTDAQSANAPGAPSGFDSQLIAAGLNTKFINQFTAFPGTITPGFSLNGYIGWSGTNIQSTQISNTYQYNADFTKTLGRHTMKVGASYATNNFVSPIARADSSFDAPQTSNPLSTTITGNAVASFLLGVPTSSQRRDSLETEHDGSVQGFYIQDQFKATPKLSLNVGFRYDVAFWPVYGDLKNGQGYVGTMDLSNGTYVISAVPPACSSTQGAPCIPGGTLPDHVVVTGNKNRNLHNTDYGNWQGRVGFAYRVRDDLAIRGGYTRFYDEWNGVAQTAQNAGGNWPSVGLLDLQTQNQATAATQFINDPVGQGTSTLFYPPNTPFLNPTYFFSPNMRTPYTDQWNLGIDQQLTRQMTLSLSYVGSHSGRLDMGGIHNTALYPSSNPNSTPMSRAQFPYIAATNYDDSTSNSNYHSLQSRLDGSTHNGLTYLVSYTWSKSIDLASSGDFGVEGTSLQNPYDPRADRSVSGFDITHILNGSVVYELPFGKGKPFNPSNSIVRHVIGGWQLNGIVNLHSGTPYEVDVNGDQANTGNNFVHANRVPGQSVFPAHRTPSQWLNPAAFAIPAYGTFGDGGRNDIRTSWYRDLDMSVFRTVALYRNLNLTLRAESFNLTNTASFGTPATTLNQPNFGVMSSTQSTARQLQLAAKLNF